MNVGDCEAISWVNPFSSDLAGLRHETYMSMSMKRLVGYGIYLPPGYEKSSGAAFPVIYWLHGIRANESSGVDAGVPSILHQAIQTNRVPPMIMVLVNGANFSMYGDSYDGSIMVETALINELIPLIDRTYRTIPSREGRVIEGFSMGGYGALKLACKFPGKFSSAVSYAGALHSLQSLSATRPFIFARMFDNDPGLFQEHSLYEWVRRNGDSIRTGLPMRLIVSNQDKTFHFHQLFHIFMDRLNIPHEFRVLEHNCRHAPAPYYESEGIAGFAFHATNLGLQGVS